MSKRKEASRAAVEQQAKRSSTLHPSKPHRPRARERKSRAAEGQPTSAKSRNQIIDRLMNAHSLAETASLALRQFEDTPGIGTISLALHFAVEELYEAHADVDVYLAQETTDADSEGS